MQSTSYTVVGSQHVNKLRYYIFKYSCSEVKTVTSDFSGHTLYLNEIKENHLYANKR